MTAEFNYIIDFYNIFLVRTSAIDLKLNAYRS